MDRVLRLGKQASKCRSRPAGQVDQSESDLASLGQWITDRLCENAACRCLSVSVTQKKLPCPSRQGYIFLMSATEGVHFEDVRRLAGAEGSPEYHQFSRKAAGVIFVSSEENKEQTVVEGKAGGGI